MSEATDSADPPEPIKEARRWHDRGWRAQVIKNEDDEGWAVAMTARRPQRPGSRRPLDHGP